MYDIVIMDNFSYMYDTIGFISFDKIVSVYADISKINYYNASSEYNSTIRYFNPLGTNNYMVILKNWNMIKCFSIRIMIV